MPGDASFSLCRNKTGGRREKGSPPPLNLTITCADNKTQSHRQRPCPPRWRLTTHASSEGGGNISPSHSATNGLHASASWSPGCSAHPVGRWLVLFFPMAAAQGRGEAGGVGVGREEEAVSCWMTDWRKHSLFLVNFPQTQGRGPAGQLPLLAQTRNIN